MKKPAIFLDRDGVINVDRGYVYKIDDLEWIPGAIETIKLFNSKNFYVIIVTNQSGIARGYFTEDDLKIFHIEINKELEKFSAFIDDFFYSPFHPDGVIEKYRKSSKLRKPNTGMLEMACKKWNIDTSKSFMIGDKESDMECALNFNITGLLFKGNNLLEFVKKNINLI